MRAIFARFAVKALADVGHRLAALCGEQRAERALAQFLAQHRIEDGLQLFGHAVNGSSGLVHLDRVDHAETGVSIDFKAPLVERCNLLALKVHVHHALVDPHHLFKERDAPHQPRAGLAEICVGAETVDHAVRIAQPHDYRLLGFGHHDYAARQHHQRDRHGNDHALLFQPELFEEVGHVSALPDRYWVRRFGLEQMRRPAVSGAFVAVAGTAARRAFRR